MKSTQDNFARESRFAKLLYGDLSKSVMRALSELILTSAPKVGLTQNTQEPGIEVALNRQNPLRLRITLKSGAASTATIYHAELPWGIRDSMSFSAVRPNGEPIDLIFPVDDPGPAKISIRARETLIGDIDLRYRDLNALKKSDFLLFWAWRIGGGRVFR